MRVRHVVQVLAAVAMAASTLAVAAPHAVAVPAYAQVASTPLPKGFKSVEVDPGTGRVFVSAPASSVVTVLSPDGQVVGGLSVPGAGSLLLDGSTLYVASTTGGRIDAFNTSSLLKVGTYGGGLLLKPNALVKAGGRLWTTTGPCVGFGAQLVSIDRSTGSATVFPTVRSLDYCPFLFTSPTDPNLILGFDIGISPTTVVRLDVSTGAPVVTAELRTDNSNARDGEVLPDGKTFALASGWPYELRTFQVDPLAPWGVVYPTGTYPTAVEATAANGGLVAGGRNGIYENDIDVLRLGDPSQSLFRYDFGTTGNTVYDDGLAFSADGTRLFAVSGDAYEGTATLTVFGPFDPGGRYTPLRPARILDTRNGTGGVSGRIGSGATVDVQVTGRGGIPQTGVDAVAVNVTVTQPSTTGYLTLFPAGQPRPLASNLNFTAGKTVPNLVVVKVGVGGKVSLFNSAGASDVIFDVAGWYSEPGVTIGLGDPGRYAALVPARLLDTRSGTGGGVRIGPGGSLDVQVSGRGGVPSAGAGAAVLNVVATGTTAVSYLTVHPTGEARPLVSNLNFTAGETVSNRAVVRLGVGGRVTIYNDAGSTDVVVDVGGWFSDSLSPAGTATGRTTAVPPARILDTRDDTSGFRGPVAAGTSLTVQVTGRGGVPATGVSAVILNVTAVDAGGPGYLTLSPAGVAVPLASDVNYARGETRPNLAVVRVGTGGKVNLFTSTATQVVVDVAGWISQ